MTVFNTNIILGSLLVLNLVVVWVGCRRAAHREDGGSSISMATVCTAVVGAVAGVKCDNTL